MSECRYFPLCDMSDERCEASAQCPHYEPMPEFVRCRDCVHFSDGMVVECERLSGQPYWTDPDGFCAWGERKDDAD